MKKEYTKPVIILENFSMTQSIAHNCGDNLIFDYATLKYKGSCGWDDGSGVVLLHQQTQRVLLQMMMKAITYLVQLVITILKVDSTFSILNRIIILDDLRPWHLATAFS